MFADDFIAGLCIKAWTTKFETSRGGFYNVIGAFDASGVQLNDWCLYSVDSILKLIEAKGQLAIKRLLIVLD